MVHSKLDLNRWKYGFALLRKEVSPQHRHRRHRFTWALFNLRRYGEHYSTSVLVDVPQDESNYWTNMGVPRALRTVKKCLQEGGPSWRAASRTVTSTGQAASVVLELVPPHDPCLAEDVADTEPQSNPSLRSKVGASGLGAWKATIARSQILKSRMERASSGR